MLNTDWAILKQREKIKERTCFIQLKLCNPVHKIHRGKTSHIGRWKLNLERYWTTKKYQNQYTRRVYALLKTTIGDITGQLIGQMATFKEIMCTNLLIGYRYYKK
jgi:uncharacterized membrane protein YoaK (UPF0700 family)